MLLCGRKHGHGHHPYPGSRHRTVLFSVHGEATNVDILPPWSPLSLFGTAKTCLLRTHAAAATTTVWQLGRHVGLSPSLAQFDAVLCVEGII